MFLQPEGNGRPHPWAGMHASCHAPAGAAGLFRLAKDGQLSGTQLLVASVTLTLFLPGVAQLPVMKKERGLRTSLIMAAAIFATAFLVGGTVNQVLIVTGYEL